MRILIVSSSPFLPAGSGVCTRLLGLVESLESMGCEVTFVYVVLFRFQLDRVSLAPMRQRLGSRLVVFDPWDSLGAVGGWLSWIWTHLLARFARHPLRRLRAWMSRLNPGQEHNALDGWYPAGLDRLLRSLGDDWQAMIVVQVFLSRAFEAVAGSPLRLLDTIDLFTDRHLLLKRHGLSYSWYSLPEGEEIRGLNRADRVLAISQPDRQWLAARLDRPVHLLEPILAPCPLPPPGWPATLLLVGSDNPHNRVGLQWFLAQVWPELQRTCPGVRLWLAGPISNPPLNQAAITCHGLVDDLRPLYAQAWICLNPVLEGTGLSIKSLEALAYARPVMATPAASRGLEDWVGCGLWVAEPACWLERLQELLRDGKLREQGMAAAASQGPAFLARSRTQLEQALG